ncbi:hypothetical protein [Corynebacterium kozikiae]|uniref:hypothetical protein n=1 Tax=Corynebacterium kozikiae TaxID=2968469 RepID=UPI00211D0147|nr:hypothetical protein [Corynebacterium sp. 76QC2CO]MCQ9342467.1 hypothetical protein [Corynebacterium sp. 76QC2CO]
MTNSPNDENGPSQDPFDGEFSGDSQYPASNHPEDRPDFGTAGFGAAHAGGYGAGSYGAGQFGEYHGGDRRHEDLGDLMVAGPGQTVDLFEAIKYGFRITFKRWPLWLGLGLLALVALGGYFAYYIANAPLAVEDPQNFEVNPYTSPSTWVFIILALLIYPMIMRLTLLQADGKKFAVGEAVPGPHYGATFLSYLLCSLIAGVVTVVAALPLMLAIDTSTGEINWGMYSLGMLAQLVVSLLVVPLVNFAPYFAADGRSGALASVSASFQAVKANYLKTVGFYVMTSLVVMLLVLATCGLGIVVAIGVSLNATAHFYRQISGGEFPRDLR